MRANKFLILFGLFWSTLVLVFDFMIGGAIVRQFRSGNYPDVEGTVLASKVTEHHDSESGMMYGVEVSFSYSVGGRDYLGQRYRYESSSSSDSRWACRVVANHAPGTRVRVFYDPNSPEDSLLSPGISGYDLFLCAFLTPFNLVMLAFGYGAWHVLRRRWFKPPAGGVRIIAGLRQTRARLISFSPVASGLATMGAAAFASIFIVGFFGGGFHPTLPTMYVTWGLILFCGLAAAVWSWSQALSGKYDLIIDELGGALELPLTKGRTTRQRIPFANITDVYVETIQKRVSEDSPMQSAYAPALRINAGAESREFLAEWYESEKARAFVEWLNARLPARKSRPDAA